MNRIKRIVAIILCFCFVCGCGSIEEEKLDINQKKDKIQIGFCFDSFLIERWERDRDVFVSTAKEFGAEVNVQNANGNAKTQAEQINYLINKKVDVLVIVCIEGSEIQQAIKRAKDEGIYVIAYDRMISNANVDLYISFDNEQVGKIMAEAFVKNGMKNKKILMLAGSLDDNNVKMVNKGFTKVCKDNGIKIVDTFYAEGWKPELAAEYLYSHLDVLNEVDAIMCGNDMLATNTVRVLSEYRKAGKILVSGQDADVEACQRIVEGTQLITVYKPVENLAEIAAKAAICLAKGEELEGEIVTMNDGQYDLPAIILTPIGVTKENIDEQIINSGFHLREDVYLNIK